MNAQKAQVPTLRWNGNDQLLCMSFLKQHCYFLLMVACHLLYQQAAYAEDPEICIEYKTSYSHGYVYGGFWTAFPDAEDWEPSEWSEDATITLRPESGNEEVEVLDEPPGKVRKLKVKLDETFEVEFEGDYGPAFPHPSNTASRPTMTLWIRSCFDVKVDGSKKQPEGEEKWVPVQVSKSDAGWHPKQSFNITIVKPDELKDNDYGAASAVASGCGCSITCDEGASGGGFAARGVGLISILSAPDTTPQANFRFALGRDANGNSMGAIYYQQPLGSLGTLDIAGFEFRPAATGSVRIPASGDLRQILIPNGLVDLVVDPMDDSITVSFYANGDFGTLDPMTQLYPITGSPVSSYRLEAGTDVVAGDGLLFTSTRSGETTTKGFYGESNGTGSILREIQEDGSIVETTTVLDIDPVDPSIWTREVDTRTLVIVGGNEVETSVSREEHASRAWGEVLERTIQDPNGANLITEYAYYEDELNDGAAYTKRKHVIHPNGSWEKYVYNSEGNVSKTYRPWKDLPAHPDAATDLNCRYTETPTSSQSIEFILGTQTKRTQIFEDSWDGEYDANSNWLSLFTTGTATYHGTTTTNPLVTRNSSIIDELTQEKSLLYRRVSANESAERYTEEKGDYNLTTGVFTPNSTGAYTRRISTQGTLTDVSGIANKTTRTISISDFKGEHRLEMQVYTGAGYETVSVTTHEYELGTERRLLSTSKDGGVISSSVYTSPTVITHTDAYGTETTNTSDTAGRLISSVKAGIGTGTGYEAQSAITTTYEEVGLTSTTTVISGSLNLSNSTTNDLAGRLVSKTDELGRITTYSYANGGRVATQTGPGGVTRITTYYLDGQLKSVTGTGVIAEFHDYTVDGSANMVHTVYYGTGDDTSPRWKKTVTNGLGQLLQEETPGPNGQPMVAQHTYNSKGQLIKTTRVGLADTLYVYDNLGRMIRQGADLNANGSPDLVSADPIEERSLYYEKDLNDDWWEVRVSGRYLTDNDDEDVADHVRRHKLGTGAESVVEVTGSDGTTAVTITSVDRPNKTVTTTTTNDLSNVSAVQVQVNGLLVSQSSMTVNASVLLRYDALGRQTQQIDPRTNQPSSTTVYNVVGQITSVTDGEGNATTYTYYGNTHANAGLLATQSNQEGETTRYAYNTLGRITHQWGNAVYPLAYAYNAYGDMTQLRTFRTAGDWTNTSLPASFGTATPSVTTWGYHAGSGLQTSKTDDSNETVAYTYHDSGLLATRTWARGVNTSYTYDTAGRLTGVDYADSTPDVTYTYRRDGQRVTGSDAAGNHAYTYHEGIGTPATETVTGGLLDGLALTWSVDGSNRPNGYSASLSAAPLNAVSYGYDATSRMNQVSAGVQSAEYGYAANSDLLQTTTLKDNTITRLTGTRVYDNASRLGSITWTNSAILNVSSHSYTYDGANRRLRADLADGSYWEYSYNDKGEVISGVKKNAGGTAYPGLNHGYTFDEIGNRLTATVDAEGGGNRSTSYASNGLNQYTSISHPSAFDVTGSAVDTSIVKVNTFTAQRQGKYFRKELPVSNSGQPVWANVEIEVTLPGAGVGGGDIVTTRNGHRYIAPTPESPDYDEDGNLVSDGRWVYTWDGENRLIAMETTPAAIAIGVPKRKLEFAYDGGSRRIAKQVYDWDSGTSSWTLNSERRFIYDQWNLMAEVDGSGNLLKSHVWGLDLSQTMQRAGGVGGLLWSTDHTGSSGQSHFAVYDGNGNVTALVNASTASSEAQYDYDAFGRTVLVEGSDVTESNTYRFSTKYEDAETELYYYGFRYYSTELGRWLNRDPIGERGGVNLYGMVRNDPINQIDILGLKDYTYFATTVATFDATKEDYSSGMVYGASRSYNYKKWGALETLAKSITIKFSCNKGQLTLQSVDYREASGGGKSFDTDETRTPGHFSNPKLPTLTEWRELAWNQATDYSGGRYLRMEAGKGTAEVGGNQCLISAVLAGPVTAKYVEEQETFSDLPAQLLGEIPVFGTFASWFTTAWNTLASMKGPTEYDATGAFEIRLQGACAGDKFIEIFKNETQASSGNLKITNTHYINE